MQYVELYTQFSASRELPGYFNPVIIQLYFQER